MMDVYDNAIVQFADGAFGYVHLTWKAQSPHFEFVGDEAALVSFLHGGMDEAGADQRRA